MKVTTIIDSFFVASDKVWIFKSLILLLEFHDIVLTNM